METNEHVLIYPKQLCFHLRSLNDELNNCSLSPGSFSTHAWRYSFL